jgi:hypothetical protein
MNRWLAKRIRVRARRCLRDPQWVNAFLQPKLDELARQTMAASPELSAMLDAVAAAKNKPAA